MLVVVDWCRADMVLVVVVILAGLLCCKQRYLGFDRDFHSVGCNLNLSCLFLQNFCFYLLSFDDVVIVVVVIVVVVGVVDIAVVVVEVPLGLWI